MIGPTRINPNWLSKLEGGISLYDFDINWEKEEVTCPGNKSSIAWRAYRQEGKYPQDRIQVRFSRRDCTPCKLRKLCTRSDIQSRILNFQPQARYEALKYTRDYIASKQGQQDYRIRAGIEGTIAQAVGAFGGRRSRYRSQVKTHFQQVMISSAINIVRVDHFLQGKPKGKAQISRFAKLKIAP